MSIDRPLREWYSCDRGPSVARITVYLRWTWTCSTGGDDVKRQLLRKALLLVSFSAFPITVIYLSPAPPLMSLREEVVNLSVLVIAAGSALAGDAS